MHFRQIPEVGLRYRAFACSVQLYALANALQINALFKQTRHLAAYILLLATPWAEQQHRWEREPECGSTASDFNARTSTFCAPKFVGQYESTWIGLASRKFRSIFERESLVAKCSESVRSRRLTTEDRVTFVRSACVRGVVPKNERVHASGSLLNNSVDATRQWLKGRHVLSSHLSFDSSAYLSRGVRSRAPSLAARWTRLTPSSGPVPFAAPPLFSALRKASFSCTRSEISWRSWRIVSSCLSVMSHCSLAALCISSASCKRLRADCRGGSMAHAVDATFIVHLQFYYTAPPIKQGAAAKTSCMLCHGPDATMLFFLLSERWAFRSIRSLKSHSAKLL